MKSAALNNILPPALSPIVNSPLNEALPSVYTFGFSIVSINCPFIYNEIIDVPISSFISSV
nr:hypothetical protein [uncultured Clostridium sp.]